MHKIAVRPFEPSDVDAVIGVILPIQREEFGIVITADEQPDLHVIPDFYQTGRGGFWVATADDRIVGTVGLKDIGAGNAALRKMFVAAEFRGRDAVRHGLEKLLRAPGAMASLNNFCVTRGDIALLRADWFIRNGEELIASGSAAEIIRRQIDGRWLYVIDHAFGASRPAISLIGASSGSAPRSVSTVSYAIAVMPESRSARVSGSSAAMCR